MQEGFLRPVPQMRSVKCRLCSMYLTLKLNNLTCPLAHIVLVPVFCTSGDVISIVWNTFPPSTLSIAPPGEFSGDGFFCLSQGWSCFYEHCSYSPDSYHEVNCSVVMVWWNWIRNLQEFTTWAFSVNNNTVKRRIESNNFWLLFCGPIYQVTYISSQSKLNVGFFPPLLNISTTA